MAVEYPDASNQWATDVMLYVPSIPTRNPLSTMLPDAVTFGSPSASSARASIFARSSSFCRASAADCAFCWSSSRCLIAKPARESPPLDRFGMRVAVVGSQW